MEKFMIDLLPIDAWYTISGHLFDNVCLGDKPFPKHKYLLQTFANNTDYIKNKHKITQNIGDLRDDVKKSLNFGIVIHLCDLKRLYYNCAFDRMFASACKNGRMEMLKYLGRAFRLSYKYEAGTVTISNALTSASGSGHLKVLKHLVRTYGLDEKYNINHINEAFMRAIEKKRPKTLKYLINAFKFYDAHIHSSIHLTNIYTHMHIDKNMLMHLLETHGLNTAIYIVSNALMRRGGNKNWKTLKYLIRTLKFDRTYVENDRVFLRACYNGHLDTIRFMTENLKLSRTNTVVDHKRAFQHACENRHFAAVEFLYATFGLSVTDMANNPTFMDASKNLHADVAEYLTRIFKKIKIRRVAD